MTASLLLALRRRLWLLIVIPIVLAVAVFLTTPEREEDPVFISTAIVAADPSTDFIDQRVRQDALLMREDLVAERAVELYGTDMPPYEFRNRLSVEADTESYVIRVSASGDTPDEVQEYVSAFSEAFIDVIQARANESLVAEIFRAQANFDAANTAYDTFVFENQQNLESAAPEPAVVAERDALYDTRQDAKYVLDTVEAEVETLGSTYEIISAPRGSRPAPNTLDMLGDPPVRAVVAAVLGLLLLVGVIAALDRIRPRVTDRLQVEEAVGAPVLSMVPRVRSKGVRRLVRSEFQGPGAEAHRTLRVHLQFLTNGLSPSAASTNGQAELEGMTRQPTVAIVSPGPGDGKTTTAAMLAVAFAEADVDTLVLGCDFRRPTVQKAFDVALSPGLTDRRGIEPTPELPTLIRLDPETGVRVLASGRPSTHNHHVLADAHAVMRAASSVGRAVVLDTAPVLVASETSQLAALADFVVMVVHAGRTSMRALAEATTTLELNDIDITGVVMIGSPEASDYSYYYGEYQRSDDDTKGDARVPEAEPEVAEASPR